ncbi:MAG: RNA polymerase subunit sigma-70 [Flavobacteriaceae bacterium]|nr:RNA polymerase subunit sigma-70 [Flavobacteriaceae bacterium]
MQLYNLYCQAMFVIANRYVNDSFLAEDVMQEAFIKAFKNIKSYRNEVPFGAWLKKIVINQSIDALKKKKLELISMNEETLRVVDDEDWKVDSTITVNDIKSAMEDIKEKYRLVLSLYLFEGYDHEEISQILGISSNTSRTHLLRGKRILKEKLKSTSYAARY